MSELKDLLLGILLIFGICISITLIFFIPLKFLEKIKCENMYNDTQFHILGGCMIKHNGEYLPEELYIRAFEKNLNINLK